MSNRICSVAFEATERGPLSPREPKARNSRTRLSALLAAIVLLVPLHLAFAAPGEDDKLQAFFKSYLEQNFRQQPMAATGLGDHRFDAQLDDISPEARAGWKKLTQQTLKQLPKQVDYQKLSRAGQVDFEILQQELRRDLWLTENFRPFEEDPRTYGRYINDSIYVLLTQSTLPAETNIANCLPFSKRPSARIVAQFRSSRRNCSSSSAKRHNCRN
jgi:hypothetical protein